jgi:2-C-methyl-D-erythritol 4-phosphate cytidylyltransferase
VADTPSIHALIPAAGRSVRFGGTTLKQYAHLNGIPVIAHSIEAISAHPMVASVTVALAEDDGIFDELVRPAYPAVHTVTGGDSRAQTVLNGLQAIQSREPGCDWVLVHDAARPCLSREALNRLVVAGLASESGAIMAVPVSDTLKWADEDNGIERTIDRSRCWAAQTPQMFRAPQTPQMFRAPQLAAELNKALADGLNPTDEAAAMERAGHRPLLVEGRTTNIKITGAADLALAEFILHRQTMRD